MRKSSVGFVVLLLIFSALILGILILVLFQKAWLKMIQDRLRSSEAFAFPTSNTPISNFSFPTAPAPVAAGKEAIIKDLGITVTRVISPANRYMGNAALPSVLREGKEYLVVNIKVRCISSKEKCHLTEYDFGVETKSGHDYPAELSGSYSDTLKGVFEGGDIEPGKSMSGSLIFILEKGERGLILVYPRLFAFGGSAKFDLGK